MNAMMLETAMRERLRPAGEQPFAVIDFDNTCIVNDIGEAALAFMCENLLLRYGGLLSAAAEPCDATYHERVFRHYHQILAQGDIRGASLLCARIFAGFRREEAAAVVAATLAAEGTQLGERELYGLRVARGLAVRAALRALIDFAAANRIDIWIVSASPAIAVDAAMRRFAIAGRLIALRHRIESGILSSAIEEPCPIAEGKVDCIRTFIDPRRRPLLAVGDSDYDLPMIEYAELHAVVERNNALTQTARQQGWFVLPS